MGKHPITNTKKTSKVSMTGGVAAGDKGLDQQIHRSLMQAGLKKDVQALMGTRGQNK